MNQLSYPIYRMYIDESGTHTYKDKKVPHLIKAHGEYDPNQYLSLIGIVIHNQYYRNSVIPQWNNLKDIFNDPDEDPIIFHYNDIIHKKGPFEKLNNSSVDKMFGETYLDLLNQASFSICCVVLDKKAHVERQGRLS